MSQLGIWLFAVNRATRMLVLSICLCCLVASCFKWDMDGSDQPPIIIRLTNNSDSCEMSHLRYTHSGLLSGLDTVDAGLASLAAGDTLVDSVKRLSYGSLLYDCTCPDSVTLHNEDLGVAIDSITDEVYFFLAVDCD